MEGVKHFIHPKNSSKDPEKTLAMCSYNVASKEIVTNEKDVNCKKCIRLLDVLCTCCRGTGLKKNSDENHG